MQAIFGLCGTQREKQAAGPSDELDLEDTYRPTRALAREMIDEEAMEFHAGSADTPRSNFMVGQEPKIPVNKPVLPLPTGVPLMPGGKAPSTLSAPVGVSPQQAEILAEELKKEGNQLYNDGQLEAAEMVYSEAIKYAPKNHILFSNRSMCYGKLGRYVDALTDAKTVVAMMPTWAKGFARLAAALEALGKYQEALQAYEKARWLAQAHDNDPQGEQEYEEAVLALKNRMAYVEDDSEMNSVRL